MENNNISLSEYQKRAMNTAIYPKRGRNILYPMLGLIGETGELVEKIKKVIRDDNGKITAARRESIRSEMGDILWYLAAICTEAKIDLGAAYLLVNKDKNVRQDLFLLILQLPHVLSQISKSVEYCMDSDVSKHQTDIGDNIATMLKLLMNICLVCALDLNKVAEKNLEKLWDRHTRGVIKGDGDDR